MNTTLARTDPLDAIALELARVTDGEATIDDVLLLRGKLEEHIRECRRMMGIVDEQGIRPHLEKCGGELVAGDLKFYLAADKAEKPRDFRTAIDTVLNACGGDVDAFVDCLSINSLKPGKCKKVLGDAFNDVFEVSYSEKVKVQVLNQKYLT